jgi:Crp-like helix-turn-helix domain
MSAHSADIEPHGVHECSCGHQSTCCDGQHNDPHGNKHTKTSKDCDGCAPLQSEHKEHQAKHQTNHWHVIESEMYFYWDHELGLRLLFQPLCIGCQNTFDTPTATPTDTVTRRAYKEVVEDLSLRTVVARVARLLVDRARGAQTLIEELPSSSPQYTQDEIAAMVGSVREVVQRGLKTLEHAGLIQMARGRIQIIDLEALEGWFETELMNSGTEGNLPIKSARVI